MLSLLDRLGAKVFAIVDAPGAEEVETRQPVIVGGNSLAIEKARPRRRP